VEWFAVSSKSGLLTNKVSKDLTPVERQGFLFAVGGERIYFFSESC
jgi:hypothetical protein